MQCFPPRGPAGLGRKKISQTLDKLSGVCYNKIPSEREYKSSEVLQMSIISGHNRETGEEMFAVKHNGEILEVFDTEEEAKNYALYRKYFPECVG